MTLYANGKLEDQIGVTDQCLTDHVVPYSHAPHRETAGYGSCTNCGCGRYSDNGTGDCYCGHSFGQHYS